MTKRAIIRIGDPTSHNGTVLEGFSALKVYGKNAAGIGHRGHCPQCKRDFVIVAGAANYTFMGKNVALEGMKTSCGATLIATQGQATVDTAPSEPVPISSQSVRYQAPNSGYSGTMSGSSVANRANSPSTKADQWIKFRLDNDGSCAGLSCVAYFDDGSQMLGEFDASNQVAFYGVSGSHVDRIEFIAEESASGGSIIETLLGKLGAW